MGDQNTTQGASEGAGEEPKQPADKPVKPNEDVEGGNGPVNT